MSILYLCCPYSHPDPAVQFYRYQKACRAQAKLIEAGVVVFSPLANSVPAVELGGLTASHSQFMALDLPILERCDEVLVLGLPGWTESRGVRSELFEALALAKPITQIDEGDIELLPYVKKTSRRFLKSALLPVVDDIS